MQEVTESSSCVFDRERLKNIMLIKSDQGNYCVRVETLNKETLRSAMVQIYLTPKTLLIVVGMAMKTLGAAALMSLLPDTVTDPMKEV